MKMAVHNGVFHADEVFGVALMETIEPDLQVIRTRDEAVIAECDIVADVGGVNMTTIKQIKSYVKMAFLTALLAFYGVIMASSLLRSYVLP